MCSGAGGLASERVNARFAPVRLLHDKPQTGRTILANRPHWKVVCEDLVESLPHEPRLHYEV